MLRAYRLFYPESLHAPPELWEWEQPYIGNLILNARTFKKQVVHRYFRNADALVRENARIWNRDYRPYPLYASLGTWEVWLKEYREIIQEVQAIADAHGWRGPLEHASP